MIFDYINHHIREIKNTFNTSPENIDILLNLLSNTKNIFFTGVGKNGHVASKAASTFNSLGIRVMFINPVDAVHGDMGLIDNGDLIVAISKSGNTEELLCFLRNCKKRTNNIFLIHSNKNNKGLEYCNNQIYLPIEKEADHLSIVPTVSIVVYTILLQSIACHIAEEKKLTISDFTKNHPGGTLGKLI